jgi:chemotaxis protein MotB
MMNRAITYLALAAVFLVVSSCCGEQEQTIGLLNEKVEQLGGENEKLSKDLEQANQDIADVQGKLEKQADLLAEMKKREKQAEERLATLKGMLKRFGGMIETGKLEVKVLDGKMVLELPSAVLFESGSAEISEEGMATLDEVAEVLKTIKDREFQVAGHTDNKAIGPDNPHETNWHLSAARAVAVVIHLRKAGVPAKQLSAAGYSQFKPVASNKNKSGQAKNRRIEITLLPNIEELPDLSDLQHELGDVSDEAPVDDEENESVED